MSCPEVAEKIGACYQFLALVLLGDLTTGRWRHPRAFRWWIVGSATTNSGRLGGGDTRQSSTLQAA